MADLWLDGRWEAKGTYVFYLELVTDLLHLFVYILFFGMVSVWGGCGICGGAKPRPQCYWGVQSDSEQQRLQGVAQPSEAALHMTHFFHGSPTPGLAPGVHQLRDAPAPGAGPLLCIPQLPQPHH